MLKKIFLGLLGIVIVIPIIGALAGAKAVQIKKMMAAAAAMVPPATPVTATEVRAETWNPRISAVGTVTAVQGVHVSTEADGVVREILFNPGSMVKAGDVLVRLDSEIEEAQLRSAEAASELAKTTVTRSRDLFASHTISQAELDSAEAQLKQANAAADNVRAVIAKKVVRAPFDGRLGIREISVGQFLQRGSPVVWLQSFDPVYVDFSLPQQSLGEIKEGLKIEATCDAYADKTFAGKITAINPGLDPTTRNARVQATLPNPDKKLLPGMFVSVDTILARSEDVLVIPATAVLAAPYGDSVFVIEEGKAGADGKKTLTVRQQFVHLGTRRGDFVAITDGVKAGEQIVTSGVFKLRPNMPVVIDNTLAPDAKMAPKPENA